MRLGGIILTGGRSQRMGRAKEALPFGDATLLARQCTTVSAAATPVVVVARAVTQDVPALPLGVEIAFDDEPDLGPLAGIVAGLARLRERHGFVDTDAAFVTANDMPFVTADAIRWLAGHLGEAMAVVPRAFGAAQPLCAVYRMTALPVATAMLARGERTPKAFADLPDTAIVDEAALRAFDPELRLLRNVNTPAEYDAARAEQDRP